MADNEFIESPHLAGAADLFKKLTQLHDLDGNNILRSAARAGMAVTYKNAKARLAVIGAHSERAFRTYRGRLVAPGFASRNVRLITTRPKGTNGDAIAILGVRKEAYYAVQFLEIGTSKMAAQPWLRPAFYGTKEQQLAAMSDYLHRRIVKIAATGTP